MNRGIVYLPDDLTARWKASGLSLSELVRRGLDTIPGTVPESGGNQLSGDAVAVLLRIETTMNEALGRMALGDPDDAMAQASDEEPVDWDERQEDHHRQRAASWRDQLLADAEPGRDRVMTAAAAAVILHCSDGAARDRLRLIESYGLAVRADDGTPPHHWSILAGPVVAAYQAAGGGQR